MMLLINTENIELGERTKARLQDIFEKLQRALPGNPQVRVFLKRIGRSEFRTTVTVRTFQQDIAYTNRGHKLVPLIRDAESQLIRRIRNQKQKIVHARKRRRDVRAA